MVSRDGILPTARVMGLLCMLVLIAPCEQAMADGCPNESLRAELNSAQLPDCRALELVSPSYVEGASIQTPTAISQDGSQLIVDSLGAIADTENDPSLLGAFYKLSRLPSGWSATPLSPSPERSPDAIFLAASADLSQTIWQLRAPGESINSSELVIREPDGAFREMGPLAPPAAAAGPIGGVEQGFGGSFRFAGASSNLSHVLIDSVPTDTIFYWPGDETLGGGTSLYEYAGVGEARPELVGVDNAGHQLSRCGIVLGGKNDKYNAVSESGATVFFTALSSSCGGPGDGPPANALYARLNGTETVAISAATGSPAGADFQGASADGSKAVFLMDERLYEYDFHNLVGENLVSLAAVSEPKVQGVARVARDGSHVYFVAQSKLAGVNAEGREPEEGKDNLYLFERDQEFPEGQTTFVATLSEEDAEDWQPLDDRPVETTPDGRYLLFVSAAHLTADDTSSGQQLFEYDARNHKLARVSIGQRAGGGYLCPTTGKVEEGFNCDGNAASVSIRGPFYSAGDLPNQASAHLAISSDGTTIVFESAVAFAPGAVAAAEAGRRSAYEYHSTASSSAGSIADGELALISDGRDPTPEGTKLYGLDATGQDIFFSSGNPLIGADRNSQQNIYDARAGGGFAEARPPVRCESEACLGPVVFPDAQSGVEKSSSVPGSGDVTAPLDLGASKSPPHASSHSFTRTQKRRAALKKCRKRRKGQRKNCVAHARRQFQSKRGPTNGNRGNA